MIRFLLITPPTPNRELLRSILPELFPSVDAVLLRWPRATVRNVYEMGRELVVVERRPRVLISDRLDVALACKADGVHLAERGLHPSVARRLAPALIVGASRHDARGLAEVAETDYVTISPIFDTVSKPGAATLGTDGLARVCAHSPVPVLALGGIDAGRARRCHTAGAAGIAVLSAVWNATDPVAAAKGIRAALESALSSRDENGLP